MMKVFDSLPSNTSQRTLRSSSTLAGEDVPLAFQQSIQLGSESLLQVGDPIDEAYALEARTLSLPLHLKWPELPSPGRSAFHKAWEQAGLVGHCVLAQEGQFISQPPPVCHRP